MARIVLYHNPACSKSRGAKQILAERDVDFDAAGRSGAAANPRRHR
ncbi:MAG: hypothetical protein J4F45_07330 [Pseudomonadales bacterium]|nr:hypothetical protein [Pseudomonadales bacterium]